MKFFETPLRGVFTIELEKVEDARGFFARAWSIEEMESRGLDSALTQCSVSFNLLKGTLRGLHYQVDPFAEAKIVRCTQGAAWDVVVDLRRDSPTFRSWTYVDLSAENRRMVYIPKGFAHGFLTTEDRTELFYQISVPHSPDHTRGLPWDDPAFNIQWPFAPTVMSELDRARPPFRDQSS